VVTAPLGNGSGTQDIASPADNIACRRKNSTSDGNASPSARNTSLSGSAIALAAQTTSLPAATTLHHPVQTAFPPRGTRPQHHKLDFRRATHSFTETTHRFGGRIPFPAVGDCFSGARYISPAQTHRTSAWWHLPSARKTPHRISTTLLQRPDPALRRLERRWARPLQCYQGRDAATMFADVPHARTWGRGAVESGKAWRSLGRTALFMARLVV
jgi:hypothetical protein